MSGASSIEHEFPVRIYQQQCVVEIAIGETPASNIEDLEIDNSPALLINGLSASPITIASWQGKYERGFARVILPDAALAAQFWGEYLQCFTLIEAAGGKVYSPEGLVLVIRRFGNWDLPKGKIEAGEIPSQAAIREVQEETGLNDVVILEQLPVIYHLYQNYHDHNNWVIKKTYWFKMFAPSPNRLVPQTIESIEEAKWVSVLELANLSTYRSLEKLFKE